MKLYFYVSFVYSIVNPGLAAIVLMKARRNVLSQIYAFCVLALVSLGCMWYSQDQVVHPLAAIALREASAFIYALFPFFFLHLMLIFLRRYEIANSKTILFATYSAGFFCYILVLLKLIPLPFVASTGLNSISYIYYITWMSMLFAIGVALLYSLIGGFAERGMRSNLLFVAFALLMLLLPTPFTLSVFSVFSDNSFVLYFISSTASLTIIVYLVFRHRMTMNMPYQAMKAALAAMNDVIIKTDTEFTIEMVQGAVMTLLGYSEEDLLRKNLADLVKQRDSLEEYRKAVQSEKLKECFFHADFICSNGSTLPMEFSLTPVYGNEEVLGFVGVGRNIAERKRAEQALHESESRYRLLFESNPSPMWVYDLETHKYLLVNTAAIRHYGYSADQFLSMNVEDITDPGDLLPGDLRTGVHRRKDGAPFEAETVAHDITFGEHAARLVLVNDITERKRAERAVRRSEENYRRYFQEDLTGYMCCTATGRITVCNPAFARIFGFSSTREPVGSNVRALYPSAFAYDAMIRSIRQKRNLQNHEERLIRVDGKPVHVIENVTGTFREEGELTEIRTYIFDITVRKRLEEELRHAQKMENLGSLAGGIAHDFNNILAIISVHASMLSRVKPSDEKTARSVEALRNAGKRGAALASQLLTFARKKEVAFEPVNAVAALEDIVKMIQPTFPKTITVELKPGTGNQIVQADFNQLQQLLMNLCVNARDAMASGGHLILGTETFSRSALYTKFPDATEPEYVCITVTDTGMGMDAETRSRIFEPFFTTKGVGKGTGLGLAVVYGIVKSHQGYIEVDSEPGRGTTFRIYLRAQQKAAGTGEMPTSDLEGIRGGSETILLVEDEDLLMVPLRDVLEEYGYHVLAAQDGNEAVEVYSRNQETIDLVISDIGLPGQSGWEAFLQMQNVNPKVRAVLASGNFDVNKKAEMREHGVSHFIQKPYVPDEVLLVVRQLLDAEQPVHTA